MPMKTVMLVTAAFVGGLIVQMGVLAAPQDFQVQGFNGRFQFVILPNPDTVQQRFGNTSGPYVEAAGLLDTQSGRLWCLTITKLPESGESLRIWRLLSDAPR